MTDPEGRIEGTGKKMRHIKVRGLEDIRPEQYVSWVREAVALSQRESAWSPRPSNTGPGEQE